MTESTLSVSYDDLRTAIAHYLGLTMTEGSWSVNDLAVLELVIKRGLRQFYFPPSGYQWNFLKPIETIDTIAPYSTGTIAVALGGTTVTLTTGVWPSWAYTHGTLVVKNVEYAIASRTDNAHIELSSAWTETTETAAEYSLKHDGNYDLPDDFGGIEDKLICESSRQSDIILVGEGRIRSLRRSNSSQAHPVYAAIRPKEHLTTTTGQRFEIMFYPLPSTVETWSYLKRILPQMLVDTTVVYPYGGAIHGETILASCLSVAEEQENDELGIKKKIFDERLAASIVIDKQFNSVDYYGYNSDNSDAVHREGLKNRGDDDYLVTYLGRT